MRSQSHTHCEVTHLVQCSALKFLVFASLNPVLFFRSFSATLRAKFYIYTPKNRRYLIFKNLFMQAYQTRKQGKLIKSTRKNIHAKLNIL